MESMKEQAIIVYLTRLLKQVIVKMKMKQVLQV